MAACLRTSEQDPEGFPDPLVDDHAETEGSQSTTGFNWIVLYEAATASPAGLPSSVTNRDVRSAPFASRMGSATEVR